jgi:hypothetical protein
MRDSPQERWYDAHKDDPEFKKKRSEATRRFFKTPKGKVSKRRARLMFIFGMTLEEYEALYEKQKGLCAICGRPQRPVRIHSRPVTRLSVDHDHETGENRGLLCTDCNPALGGFQDSPDILRQALAYLASWGKV